MVIGLGQQSELGAVVGLVLGKGRGDEDTTINTVSAILLTLGFVVVLSAVALELVGRLRHRT